MGFFEYILTKGVAIKLVANFAEFSSWSVVVI